MTLNLERALIDRITELEGRLAELERAPVPRTLGTTLGTKFGAPVVAPWFLGAVNNQDAPGVPAAQNAGGVHTELQSGSTFQIAHNYWGNSVWLNFNAVQTTDGNTSPGVAGVLKYAVAPGANNSRAASLVFDANTGTLTYYQYPISTGLGADVGTTRPAPLQIDAAGMVTGGNTGANGLRSNGHLRILHSTGRTNIFHDGVSAGSIQFVTGNNGAWCEMWQGATMISDDYSIARNYWLQLRYDSAAKPGTNVWTVASDEAVKQNVRPFTLGSAYLRSLPKPVEFEYNGEHDTPAGLRSVGYVAQELETAAPSMVEVRKVPRWVEDKIGGVQKQDGETEMRFTNTGDLIHIHTNVLLEILDRLDAIDRRLQGGAPGTPPNRS